MSKYYWEKELETVEDWLDENYDDMGQLSVFGGCINVMHMDGSQFSFVNAFGLEFENEGGVEILAVVTEHNGTHIFGKGDLEHYWPVETKIIDIE